MAPTPGLHPCILDAIPITEHSQVEVVKHGESHFGSTSRLIVHNSIEGRRDFFLKVLPDEIGVLTCQGEFEALRAIYSTCKSVPQPYQWGRYTEGGAEKGFLLTEFLEVVQQPADPLSLSSILATLHLNSVSPTGQFGFHISTIHTKNVQAVAFWTDSWCELFASHFSQILSLAKAGLVWPEFDESNGRTIKPSLLHGDCWDGNTALTAEGRAVFFDVASFYGHNEYDLGDWRPPRHVLSDPAYVREYHKIIPRSEPVEEWNDRNLLYSLTWNICNALYIPKSSQRSVIYEDAKTLCQKFCPDNFDDTSIIVKLWRLNH